MDLNREHWDESTDIHARDNVYGIEDFKAGRCQLHRIEVDELGDVSGKRLLHLQCHFGLGTLSWARRGAVVTGVDFSPKAIALARSLAAELSIEARFVESNLYALPAALTGRFDVVFTEAHPSCRIFPTAEDITDGSTELRPMFPYFHDPAGTRWEPSADYADATARHTVAEHNWRHSMGDIVNALVNAGLQIDFLHEFSHCVWKVVAFAERDEDGTWRLPARFPQLNRRAFLGTLGLFGVPVAVEAQQAGKVYRIGMLETRSAALNAANLNAFRDGLRELGYREGQTSRSRTGRRTVATNGLPAWPASWFACPSI